MREGYEGFSKEGVSFAPPGLCWFWDAHPQLKLRAIFCRPYRDFSSKSQGSQPYIVSIKTVAADETRAVARLRKRRLSLRSVDPGLRSQTRLSWAILCHPLRGFWFGGCAELFEVKANRCRLMWLQFFWNRYRRPLQNPIAIAQTSPSAESRISKSAGFRPIPSAADWEVGDTAGLETCATDFCRDF